MPFQKIVTDVTDPLGIKLNERAYFTAYIDLYNGEILNGPLVVDQR
ncbi:hypothetical protein [Lactiplantibacillus plantarum]|nr:hypothetical protein [Lactiplantibacillus plantarum]QYN63666.1 hypothetical protein G7B65_12495 [Lactiplantibacillus plantarum]